MTTSEEFGERLMAFAARTMNDEQFAAAFSPEGLAPTRTWSTEDDWIVQYTTKRIRGGTLAGLFSVMIFKPEGSGSKRQWRRVKTHECDTRKEAKQLALRFFYDHSPKLAAKHGWNGKEYVR